MGRLTVLLVRVSHHCSSQGTWPMGSYIILGPVLLGHSLSDRGSEIWVLPGENKADYSYPKDKEPHTGFPSWPRTWSMSHAQKLCSVAPWCLVWEWVRVGLNLTFLLEWPRQSETLPPIRLCTSALSSTSEGCGDQS